MLVLKRFWLIPVKLLINEKLDFLSQSIVLRILFSQLYSFCFQSRFVLAHVCQVFMTATQRNEYRTCTIVVDTSDSWDHSLHYFNFLYNLHLIYLSPVHKIIRSHLLSIIFPLFYIVDQSVYIIFQNLILFSVLCTLKHEMPQSPFYLFCFFLKKTELFTYFHDSLSFFFFDNKNFWKMFWILTLCNFNPTKVERISEVIKSKFQEAYFDNFKAFFSFLNLNTSNYFH